MTNSNKSTSGHGPLRVEVIRRADELAGLRGEWRALWEQCPRATPFETPEWLLPWWQHFGGGDLSVLGLRRGSRLVGLVPLYLFSGDGRRRASTLGAGITDYAPCLLAPQVARDGIEAVLDYLAAMRPRWDVADFQDIAPDSPLLEFAPADGFWARLSQQSVNPMLRLPGEVATLGEQQPPHLRRRLQRGRRRLAELGEVRVHLAAAETLGQTLDALAKLHSARWQERAQPGVLGNPSVQAFHHAAAPGLLAHGNLRLYVLSAGGTIAAVLYALAGHQRMYAYLGGFDPTLRRASPGTILMAHAIEDAVRAGYREFDFLRGAELLKAVWGASDRTTYRLMLYHRGSARPAAHPAWSRQLADVA